LYPVAQSVSVVQVLAAAVRLSPPINKATLAEIRKAWREDREAWLNMARAPLGRLLLLNPASANPMPPPTKTILPQ
jgi:hypothetical protein